VLVNEDVCIYRKIVMFHESIVMDIILNSIYKNNYFVLKLFNWERPPHGSRVETFPAVIGNVAFNGTFSVYFTKYDLFIFYTPTAGVLCCTAILSIGNNGS